MSSSSEASQSDSIFAATSAAGSEQASIELSIATVSPAAPALAGESIGAMASAWEGRRAATPAAGWAAVLGPHPISEDVTHASEQPRPQCLLAALMHQCAPTSICRRGWHACTQGAPSGALLPPRADRQRVYACWCMSATSIERVRERRPEALRPGSLPARAASAIA